MSYKKLSKISSNVYKPLGDVVYEHLKNAIISGELSEGERLMEIQIAEAIGVSRTPVRDAMKKLEQEGFIEVVPRKGAYVKYLSQKDILEVLEIRRVLEGFSAERAAVSVTDNDIKKMSSFLEDFDALLESDEKQLLAKLDEEFHGIIYRSIDNSQLKALIQSLHEQFHRFRVMYYSTFHDYDAVVVDHKNILQALIDKDSKRAKEMTESHIDSIANNVSTWFSQQKGK